MDKNFDAVVIANGDVPTHPIPLSILQAANFVVACDGAVEHVTQATFVIGDGDSTPHAYRDRLIQVNEQEDNDLTKATLFCIKHFSHLKKPLKIAYLGATGKREDHTLGNIALLMRYYREMNVEGRMLTDYGIFIPAQGDHTFTSKPGQQVSIFNFGCQTIESEGLKWNSYAYEELWQGTLNEAMTDHFTIHADGYYMVFQTYQQKETAI